MRLIVPFFLAFCCVFLTTTSTHAQDVTYSKQIATIIYNNCTQCHRAGEIGPFPMTSYDEVQPWAEMIKYVTSTRQMPPWKADPAYSRFRGERFLSEEEIDLIAAWVDDGAPRGNEAEEPDLPTFVTGSQIGEPDLVLSFSEAFEHKGGNEDEYRVFVLPTGLTSDQEVAGIELRPGNSKIVHHALFSHDNTGQARALDNQDPDYGYDGYGGFGINGWWDKMFPGYVPGQKPILSPKGVGQILPAGSDFLIQMHFAPVPFAQSDSSSVNIFFKKEPVERHVETEIMVPFFPYLQNGPYLIFPNTIKRFHCKFTVNQKSSLISVWPHAHLLGQNWEVYVEHADSTRTPLISIPEWDFNWQGAYYFKKYIVVEPGDVVHGFATYDNTIANPSNPNDPPALVTWGERTTDEMFFLPITFVPYQAGDEDVVFDETTTSTGPANLHFPKHTLMPPFPNPNEGSFKVAFSMTVPDVVSIRILDIEGKLVKIISDQEFYNEGLHQLDVNESSFSQGVYLVQMIASNFNATKKVTISK